MRVQDIMSRPVYTVGSAETIEAAAALLAAHGITAMPVVDDGGLVGIVSEGDLLRRRVPADPTAHAWPGAGEEPGPRPKMVAEVMSPDVVTAWPGEDVADVARAMLTRDVRSVPVLVGTEVVGIVSRRDMLRTVVRTDDVVGREAQHRLDEYAGGTPRWSVAVVDGEATVSGEFDDQVEERIVSILTRTVPGVGRVRLAGPRVP